MLGFAGCLRRATLVALDRDDLEEHRDRLAVTIRRSKTDQDAIGRVVELPYGTHEATCPVRTLAAWLAHLDAADQASGETGPAVFRPVDKAGRIRATRLSDHSASAVITRRAAAAGLTAGQVTGQPAGRPTAQFTGHSLRAGGATSMADVGATTAEIAEHGGWSPRSAVVHDYVRRTEAWKRNAMRGLL